MNHNHTPHEAGADVLASSMRGATVKHYPRLSIRRNARGTFDAYLLKHPGAREVWVHAGATVTEARAWLPERLAGA